jgi:hypothetical protein
MRNVGGLLGVLVLIVACGGGGGNNGDGGTNDGGNNDGNGGDGGNNDGSGGAFACSQGSLYAGDPVYTGDPNLRPASGTGIKTDPPLVWQTLVISGTHLYTRQESEVWSVDMSAGSPVETKIAGTIPSGSTYDFNTGPCSSANFTQLRGLGAMSDGSLVAADYFANSIVKISNPDNPSTCTVSLIAGTAGPLTGLDPSSSSTLPPPGNANGKGSAASFNGPQALTVDPSGNIFVVDHQVSNNATIVRRIDATGFASTLLTLGTDPGAPMTITNFTQIGGSIYAAAQDDTNNSYVIAIDIVSAKVTTILGGGSDKFPPVSSGVDPAVDGITTDGKNLIIAGDGYVWYLTLAGQLTQIAGGYENSIDFFMSGYDPTATHPAMQLELPTAIGSADENGTGSFDHIVYSNGALYYRGFADGSSAFVEKIACQ